MINSEEFVHPYPLVLFLNTIAFALTNIACNLQYFTYVYQHLTYTISV